MSSSVHASSPAPVTTNIIEVAAPPDVVTDMPPTSTSVKASATPKNPESAHEDSVLPYQAATHAPIDTNWVNKLTEAEWVDLMEWVIEGRRMLFSINESRGTVKLNDIVDMLMTNEKDLEAVYDLLDTIQEEKEKAREEHKNKKKGGKDGVKEPSLGVITVVTAKNKLCIKKIVATVGYPAIIAALAGCAFKVFCEVHNAFVPPPPSNCTDFMSEVPIVFKILAAVIGSSGLAVIVHVVVQGFMALFFAFSSPRATVDEKKKKKL